MKTRLTLGVVLCFSLLLVACGGSATNDLAAFKVPQGWHGGGLGGYSMWIGPSSGNGSGQALMLMRLPYRPGSNEDLSFATTRYSRGATIKEHKTITICNNQPANYVDLVGTDKNGKRSDVQMVSTHYGGNVYMAMYMREAGAPTDTDATAAIHSLCLKK